MSGGEVALRRASGALAQACERQLNRWRTNPMTDPRWVRGFSDGVAYAQKVMADQADRERGDDA